MELLLVAAGTEAAVGACWSCADIVSVSSGCGCDNPAALGHRNRDENGDWLVSSEVGVRLRLSADEAGQYGCFDAPSDT